MYASLPKKTVAISYRILVFSVASQLLGHAQLHISGFSVA